MSTIEVGEHDLIDLERRIDEVEHRRVEQQDCCRFMSTVVELLVDQIDARRQLFLLVLGVLDLA